MTLLVSLRHLQGPSSHASNLSIYSFTYATACLPRTERTSIGASNLHCAAEAGTNVSEVVMINEGASPTTRADQRVFVGHGELREKHPNEWFTGSQATCCHGPTRHRAMAKNLYLKFSVETQTLGSSSPAAARQKRRSDQRNFQNHKRSQEAAAEANIPGVASS